MSNVEALIFDYGRTLYNPDDATFFPGVASTLATLATRYWLAIVSLGHCQLNSGGCSNEAMRAH